MTNVDPEQAHALAAAQLFDAKAQTWGDKYSGALKSRLEVFQQAVVRHVPCGAEILDFGCGAGVIALRLAQEGYSISGMDISPEMIAKAKANALNLRLSADFCVGDVNALGQLEESFDAIVSSSVLEYLPNTSQALAAISQRLRPGGHAIVSVPNRLALVRGCERAARLLARLSRGWPLPLRARRYAEYLLLSQNHFSVKGFGQLSQRNGLHVIEHTYLHQERSHNGWVRALQSSMLLFVMIRQ